MQARRARVTMDDSIDVDSECQSEAGSVYGSSPATSTHSGRRPVVVRSKFLVAKYRLYLFCKAIILEKRWIINE